MPREHLSMRKAKEVLRLKWGQSLSNRAIAASCQIGLAISCWDVASTITAGDIAWN